MLTVTCVLSGLDFEAAGGSVVRYCLSDNLLREPLSRCKHDMGALLCLTLERAPAPQRGPRQPMTKRGVL